MTKVLQPPRVYLTPDKCTDQRAVGLPIMAAVAEAALADIRPEFAESAFQLAGIQTPKPKAADTWRVDQFATLGHVIQGSGRGGVSSHSGCFRQPADLNVDIRQKRLDQ